MKKKKKKKKYNLYFEKKYLIFKAETFDVENLVDHTHI